jgi:hypothetical protein
MCRVWQAGHVAGMTGEGIIMLKTTDVPNLRCVRCDEPIKPLAGGIGTASSGMWDDAGVDQFMAGYGSVYDSVTFVVGICDKCIGRLLAAESIYLERYNEN